MTMTDILKIVFKCIEGVFAILGLITLIFYFADTNDEDDEWDLK